MTPLEAVRSCLRQYGSTAGRAGRAEYWWFTGGVVAPQLLAYGAALAALLVHAERTAAPGAAEMSRGTAVVASVLGALWLASTLVFGLPSVAVLVRRLHDSGRSGRWAWLAALPLTWPVLLPLVLAPSASAERTPPR